ncbi:MAG: Tat pathway signal protein [Thalassobius sp.]|nr:Tat pathway signal protein [Thalassovita sp.]
MDKRKFIKNLGSLGLGLAMAPTITQKVLGAAPAQTKNWMWVRPNSSFTEEDWKAKLSTAKDAGIDAILVEVYNGSDAFFDTDRFPVKEKLLEKLGPICKEVGMELHTWMWTMICRNEKIMKEHPDWYAVNGLGESSVDKPAYVDYYRFMCPNHPEVRDFVQENVRSLAAFDFIDGVHLDYVRLPDVILAEALQPKYDIVQDKEYPQYDYCYSTYCREAFKAQTGIDPLKDLEDPSANKEWREFRYNSISSLVNDMLVPEAKKKDKMITAAVFPNWQNVRQQWYKWKLDAFLPMLYHSFYNEDLTWLKKSTKERKKDLIYDQPIYSGLYVPSLKEEEFAEAYKMSMKGGASGISLFDLGSVKDEYWPILKEILT